MRRIYIQRRVVSHRVKNETTLPGSIDSDLYRISDLTWLPWVGSRYAKVSRPKRVLVVGESHYSNEPNPKKVLQAKRELSADPDFTRRVIHECPVSGTWKSRTLDNIERFLLGGPAKNRAGLWSELAFYNFIQRPMEYGARIERPTWADWVLGWEVFCHVVGVLKPSHCIFIGVEAAKSFDWVMKRNEVETSPIRKLQKIRRTWARTGGLVVGNDTVGLSFMRHCGAHFSWADWHRFLQSQCGEHLQSLASRWK